jgi:hypothetical protein
MKRILKYATGDKVTDGAEYLCTKTNGIMIKETGYKYVWHYFLIELNK